jgi:hypothetical protein
MDRVTNKPPRKPLKPKAPPPPPRPARPVGHSEVLAHLGNQERIIIDEIHRDQWPAEYAVAQHWFPLTNLYRAEQRWARKPHPVVANALPNIFGVFFGGPPPPPPAAPSA